MATLTEEKEDMSQCATISAVSVDDVALNSSPQENPTDSGFTDLSLPEPGTPDVKVVIKQKKTPKRVLHFSDGVLEEYSTDEDEVDEAPKQIIDPKSLTWPAWMWYLTTLSAAKLLGVADTCGERLAWFFGITSPKYQYAIDEYYKIKEEEEEEKKRQEREDEASWARVNHGMSTSQESITGIPPGGSTFPHDLPDDQSSVAQPKF